MGASTSPITSDAGGPNALHKTALTGGFLPQIRIVVETFRVDQSERWPRPFARFRFPVYGVGIVNRHAPSPARSSRSRGTADLPCALGAANLPSVVLGR